MSLDVRCSAHLDGPQAARCQLMAGHEDHHATVTAGPNSRMVWLWLRAHREVRELSRALAAGRPWAPTFPAVDSATLPGPDTAVALVEARPAAVPAVIVADAVLI